MNISINNQQRGGLTLALYIVITYVLLVIVGLAILIYFYEKSAFAGLYIGILTLPWSFIDTIVFDLLGIIDSLTLKIHIITTVMYSLINSFILYILISRSSGGWHKREQRRQTT